MIPEDHGQDVDKMQTAAVVAGVEDAVDIA